MQHRLMRVLAIVGLLVVPQVVLAQIFGGGEGERRRVSPVFDVRGLYSTKYDTFGLGGRVRIPLVRSTFFVPTFDYFFVDPDNPSQDFGDAWNLAADLLIELGLGLYVGGGFTLSRLVPPADVGRVNEEGTDVFVGWELGHRRPLSPRVYLETKWVFAGPFSGSQTLFQLGAGGAIAF